MKILIIQVYRHGITVMNYYPTRKENTMKVKIEYESDGLLPDYIDKKLDETLLKVQRDRLELDKIHIAISGLRYDLIKWFSANSTERRPQ